MVKFSPTRYRNVNNVKALEAIRAIQPGAEVLVLNATYEVVNITSWKRAICHLLKEKAIALSARVIRLLDYVRIPLSKLARAKPSRSMIYRRDGNRCQYCGSTRSLTIDHVVPKSRGGEDTWQNLVVACGPCNTKKGDRPLEQTGMRLERKPIAPMNKIAFIVSQSRNHEWLEYNY